jgi:hypothetical protein
VGKFDNFKIDKENAELEAKRDDYWEKCKALTHDDILERSTEMFVRGVIDRSAWLRSQLRSNAIKKARVERGAYKCGCCGGLFKADELNVDHMAAKGHGNPNLIQYVARTFCSPDKLTVLCIPCHKYKSAKEKEHYRK